MAKTKKKWPRWWVAYLDRPIKGYATLADALDAVKLSTMRELRIIAPNGMRFVADVLTKSGTKSW